MAAGSCASWQLLEQLLGIWQALQTSEAVFTEGAWGSVGVTAACSEEQNSPYADIH